MGIFEISLNNNLLFFSCLGFVCRIFTILSKNFLVMSFFEMTAFSKDSDNYNRSLKKSLEPSFRVYASKSTLIGLTFSVLCIANSTMFLTSLKFSDNLSRIPATSKSSDSSLSSPIPIRYFSHSALNLL